jgi:hypothetical protein
MLSFLNDDLPKYISLVRKAGADLCQAQDKLGLAKPALPSKKFKSFPLIKFEVIFQLKTKWVNLLVSKSLCHLPFAKILMS